MRRPGREVVGLTKVDTPELFAEFIDDAAIFPPGLMPLDEAVAQHQRLRSHSASGFVGPMVLSADRFADLEQLDGYKNIEYSGVVNAADADALSARARDAGISLRALELKLGSAPPDEAVAIGSRIVRDSDGQVAVWLELPTELVSVERLRHMREAGIGLKYRTGGVTPDLYPTSEELVTVLAAAAESGIEFKLTAGLHRAMRYTEETAHGTLKHFGFLNIAAAMEALIAERGQDTALEILNSDDAAKVSEVARAEGSWRQRFASFGCCSFQEALGTLHDLDLVDSEVLVGINSLNSKHG